MAITLPYEFDTAREAKLIVKGMLGMEVLLIIPGIIYTLGFSSSRLTTLPLFLTGMGLLYFIIRFVKHLEGSEGTITGTEVIVRPVRVCGVTFPRTPGTFSLREFSSVRVEECSGSTGPDVQVGPHERIYLVGKNGTPNILIARTDRADNVRGINLGREFGRTLDLPCEQMQVAY